MNEQASLASQLRSEEGAAANALGVRFEVDGLGAVGLAGRLNALDLDARGNGAGACLGFADNILGKGVLTSIQHVRGGISQCGGEEGREARDEGCLSHGVCFGVGVVRVKMRDVWADRASLSNEAIDGVDDDGGVRKTLLV